MQFGSVFSGIAGFDKGLEDAGHECLWQIEIDEAARSILDRHYPRVQKYTDVRKVSFRHGKGWRKHQHPVNPDALVGGFPCQDLSMAGRRSGLAGQRSGLWWEFYRLIKEAHPRWVIIENVPGLLSSNNGRDMGTILWSLAKLGYGYAYAVLDAQYFGVAQRRRRVFIVANSVDWTNPAKVLFEPESLSGDPPPSREAAKTYPSVAGTLTANGGGLDRPAGNANELDFCIPELALTLTTRAGFREDPTAETYIVDSGVRRFLPIEAGRLQGFLDNWTSGQSDNQRYKQLGNAVCRTVAAWLGFRVQMVDGGFGEEWFSVAWNEYITDWLKQFGGNHG